MNDVFSRELFEQPGALRRQLADPEPIRQAAHLLGGTRGVRLVAHGSSDNAASYGVYALGLSAGIAAVRDSISLPVYYRSGVGWQGWGAVAISQSGRTQDVTAYLEAARSGGHPTVAITNDVASPLAAAAEVTVALRAGPEEALAATKTFTCSVAALALLAGALGERLEPAIADLADAAEALEQHLAGPRSGVAEAAELLADHDRVYVIARGAQYAAAREIALKLAETCELLACPLTATDLLHGPLAALERRFPVWAITSGDAIDSAVEQAIARAKTAGAPIIVSGPGAQSLSGGARLPFEASAGPLTAPLHAVVGGQQVAAATARLRGLDPNQPSDLITKVTVAA